MNDDAYIVLNFAQDLFLDEEERRSLSDLERHTRRVEAHAELIAEGHPYDTMFVLKGGWAMQHKVLSDGRRQVLNFLLPGDLIGIDALAYRKANHSVTTLSAAVVSPFSPQWMITIQLRFPRLAAAVICLTVRQEALLHEWEVNLGRRSAYERTGHLLLELLHRLQMLGLADDRSFAAPLSQDVLADALGLSKVHVNRTLQRMRREGLISVRRGEIRIENVQRLAAECAFEKDYLIPLPERYRIAPA